MRLLLWIFLIHASAMSRLITAHQQREGGGFVVRRPIGGPKANYVDPFLMLDHLGPVDYAPGEAVGAPDHPHRGFETVSSSPRFSRFSHHSPDVDSRLPDMPRHRARTHASTSR
jgi:hypothetical protein